MSVYGYTRVSTSRQAAEGDSLATQEARVRAYCQLQGLELTEVFAEAGIPGSQPLRERPQGSRLLERLRAGDHVVSAKLDRMFRSSLDALAVMSVIREEDASLHLIDLGGEVTGTGVAKMVFTVLAAVAEAERDRIRERIEEVKRHQREQRCYLGGARPFGFQISEDGRLVEDEKEQDGVRLIRGLHDRGHSLRAISALLWQRGLKLSHQGVRRIIRDHERNG